MARRCCSLSNGGLVTDSLMSTSMLLSAREQHPAGQRTPTGHAASHGPASSWKLSPASMLALCLTACADQAVPAMTQVLLYRTVCVEARRTEHLLV